MTGKHRPFEGRPSVADLQRAAQPNTRPPNSVDHTPDIADATAGLNHQERRAVLWGTIFRVVGTPVVALLGLLNTAIIVKQTGEGVFGVVSLIATMSLLFPFADLGIGAVVTNASSRAGKLADDNLAINTIRRAYRVLGMVAAGIMVAALAVMKLDWWGAAIGLTTGPQDRYVITIAACIFALSLPAGLGIRILIGIDKNQWAVLILMTNSAFALATTAALMLGGVHGIWYALPGVIGVLVGNVLGTVVALRASGLGRAVFALPVPQANGPKLLAGSLWMFVASVGLPLGLQSHRIILSHLSTPAELSRYSLMAQLYAVAWSVFSTAGMAYWPVFVKRRGEHAETIRMWRNIIGAFMAASVVAAIGITALGPWATSILSSGEVQTTTQLAFAFGLLLLVQCVHLPSGVLLTAPSEMRWQAYCIIVMALLSIAGGMVVAREEGAAGVVLAAAVAVFVAQIVPDFVCVPRIVRRRPPTSGRPRPPTPERFDTADTVEILLR